MVKGLAVWGLLIFMAGCSPRTSLYPFGESDSSIMPGPAFLRGLPDGNDSYSVGFRDGCNTYEGIVGVGIMQFKGYKWDNNRALIDSMYAKGFSDGRNHCTYYEDPAIN